MIDFSRKKFALISLGCDKNRVDSEKLLSLIRRRGCDVTEEISEADIIVVNTCAFLNSARKEAIDTVLECAEYKKTGHAEKIVVMGCLPQKYIVELFPELTEADVFLGTRDVSLFFDALEASYKGERQNAVGCGTYPVTYDRVLTTPAHIAYLKISDGCSNRCTYCLIPQIRGPFMSTPIGELKEEAGRLGEISELILVAQDVTRYGEDLYGEDRLADLLEELSSLDNIRKIRLLYCYPEKISDGLIHEIRDNPKIIKYLDIPLQHSEDRILKLMNRGATREEYLSLIRKLRREIPGIALRSTFIAGFPTETEEECDALCDFLKEARLTNCGFFAYSREDGTPAAHLKGQVGYGTKLKRVKKLYAAQQKVSEEFLRGFVGKSIDVLCDGIDYGKSCFTGRAYFSAPDIDGSVFFRSNMAEQGKTYKVAIERNTEYDLYGKTEDYEP